ncbi:MAG: hypothetical protein DRQ37_01115 [Gammaproteobacteria bacterium]|nr:MAG: hypothetical protein DRQ37_01115 [Gammaproteobacteria bacterium]
MFIIPLEKSIDWRRPPLATLLLIVANVFIYFSLQAGDEAAFQKALDYYVESQLPETELTEFARRRALSLGSPTAEELEEQLQSRRRRVAVESLLMEMEGDAEFMHRLHTGEIIAADQPQHAAWAVARGRFEELKREAVLFGYGFVPADHRPITFLSHMFLHGGVGHLVGNMVFLFLVGFSLEMALGTLVYLSLYVLTGLGAVMLFWMAYPDSTGPLVGASGAISGLMGVYAAVFAMRRIRFFYSIFIYFDYVRAPALIMFPLWLVNEVYQLLWAGVSQVAYVAHIGGLLMGGAAGLAVRRAPGMVDEAYLDESSQAELRTQRYEEGLRLLNTLEVERAQLVFRELHATFPQDLEILQQLYKAEKFTPQRNEYHRVSRRLLEDVLTQRAHLKTANALLDDYLKVTKGKIRITPDGLNRIAARFAKGGYAAGAEKLLLALLKQKPLPAGIEGTLYALALAFERDGQKQKSQHYLGLIIRQFPGTDLASDAQKRLIQSTG